ncbi:MAG: hypothetical protein ABW005_09505 [Burkholderiaceae bacterium]
MPDLRLSRRRCLLGLALGLNLGPSASLRAEPLPFRAYDVVLLQPGEVYEQRTAGSEAVAAYLRSVGDEAQRVLAEARPAMPNAGFIVVAVKPQRQARVWLDFERPLAADFVPLLSGRLRALPALEVKNGPVVFALKVGLWGGAEPRRQAPAPADWREAARKAGHPLELGELVDAVWAD